MPGNSVILWVAVGDERYIGTCVGCYWFDPIAFNTEISAGFDGG